MQKQIKIQLKKKAKNKDKSVENTMRTENLQKIWKKNSEIKPKKQNCWIQF